MSWKKNFARRVRFGELPEIGAFKMSEEAPEPLGKGKFRCTLALKDGSKATLTTFESTIGDIIYQQPGKDGYIEAYIEKVGSENYVRFKESA